MKKALAILMVLVAVTGVAVADVADVAVSGFGKLAWGLNLDEPQVNGFKNSNEWKIVLPLLAKKTFTTKSEGDAYATISIVDAQYGIEGKHDATGFTAGDKKIDKVEAKLVFGNVYMTVTGAPSFKTNNAEIWAPIKNDGYFDDGKEGKALRFEPGFDGQGTKIGYKTDKFDVGVKLASKNAYDAAGAAAVPASMTLKTAAAAITVSAADVTAGKYYAIDGTAFPAGTIAAGTPYYEYAAAKAAGVADRKSQYAFGFDASVTPSDMVTASATFNYATWNATAAVDKDGKAISGIMSAGAKVVAKPVTDLEVLFALDAGNDYMYDADLTDADAAVQTWTADVLFSAKYAKLVELGAYYATAVAPFHGYNDEGTVAATNAQVADLAVYAKLMDGGKVENLSAWVTVMANHLLTSADSEKVQANYGFVPADSLAAPIAFGTGANYTYKMGDVKYVKPFVELYGQNMAKGLVLKGTEFVTSGKIGADYGLFTNTVITAQYEAGATNDNQMAALIKTASKSTKGLFTLACKVTY